MGVDFPNRDLRWPYSRLNPFLMLRGIRGMTGGVHRVSICLRSTGGRTSTLELFGVSFATTISKRADLFVGRSTSTESSESDSGSESESGISITVLVLTVLVLPLRFRSFIALILSLIICCLASRSFFSCSITFLDSVSSLVLSPFLSCMRVSRSFLSLFLRS